jgi:hypothetical protein
MDEASSSTPPADENEAATKRPRRTKAQMEEARRAEEAAKLAAAADLPPFHHSLCEGKISVHAQRTVRTGNYESFDLRVGGTFDRDPRFTVLECFQMLSDAASYEVNRKAAEILAEVAVEK